MSDIRQSNPAPTAARGTANALRLEITSDPAELAGVRHAMEQFATDAGLNEKAVADVGLCVNEALANVIRHAYAGAPGRPIVVTAATIADGDGAKAGDCRNRGVRITIRDWGNGIDPSTL